MTLFLLESPHAKHFHFLLCEEAPVAAAEVLLGESGKQNAVEFHHTVAQMLEDAAHDAVLSAVNLYTHLTLVGVAGILDGISMHFAVLQFYAVGNLLEVVCGDVFVEEYVVNLLLEELGMCEFRGEVAVVGEQEHASGVAVESSHGIDSLWTDALDEVHNGLALLRVVACCDAVLRLVEQHIDLLLKVYGFAAELDVVGAEHLRAEFRNHFAVDGDCSVLYVFVGFAAAAYASVGKELVKTDGFVGVDVLLLIFNALLQAVFCIRVVVGGAATLEALLITAAVVETALTLITATVETALAWLIASLRGIIIVVRTVTALLTGLVAALLTVAIVTGAIALLAGLIASLLTVVVVTGAIASLLTGLIASLLTVVVVTWAIATLLTGLITALLAVVVVTRTVATLLARLVASVA